MNRPIRYLLVTHIPFVLNSEGQPVVDSLWARDLTGLAKSVGPIHVVAPQLESLKTLGPNPEAISSMTGIVFRGFPPMKSARSLATILKIRKVLREEVKLADVVHTSNFFPPYTCLAYAHDLAVRLGKKTVFVIAEDFHDMLSWEWVRPSLGLNRWRRERSLRAMDSLTRKCAGTASLTMMHTPAAVERYRLSARNSVMIRQPGHEESQVIDAKVLNARLSSLGRGRALQLTTACRHASLKGLDLLIRAIGLLRERGTIVYANLYGSGPETERLRQLTVALGVAHLVQLPGSLAVGEQLDKALRESDLFVMPHRTTDFGRAFFDAMAAGLPVLAFRTPASAATIYDGQDGFLTPLDDVQGLAERIAMLDRERFLLGDASIEARRRALNNTRSEWYRMRAEWTFSLLEENQNAAA